MRHAQSEDEGSGSEVEVSGSDDEYESALNGSKSPSPPPARDVKGKGKAYGPVPIARSTSHQRSAKKARSWADLDLSIIVALVSPIGNWLTGGDHIKNLFLIILLIFYLHQIVESTSVCPVPALLLVLIDVQSHGSSTSPRAHGNSSLGMLRRNMTTTR